MMVQSIGEWWMWLGFSIFMVIMLALDLLCFGGDKLQRISAKKALILTLFWILLALLFNVLLWWYLHFHIDPAIAAKKATQFFTGYLIEKALSIDNIFVFLLIFNHFAIPSQNQRRVLLYGVLGAIIMRAIMILTGTWLVTQFEWILYVFGAVLVFTGIKMLFVNTEPNFSNGRVIPWLSKHLRVSPTMNGNKFFIRINGLRYVTPLFLVLILIELSDLVFALDSIPAIFAITTDPFIIFTSNIFAIMGLRALYFLLADFSERFHLIKYGLAIVLVFVGIKMLIEHWVEIPIFLSLGFIVATLAISIMLSLAITPKIAPKHKK